MAKNPKAPPKKKKVARSTVGKAATARASIIPPTKGPVTLDEARALAQAKQQPARIAARRAGIAPAVSPEKIGRARRQVKTERDAEIARREREYKAVMSIMKRRGGRAAATAQTFVPLQICAEGDSWFKYPPFLSGGIIPRLERLVGVPILDLAKAGDEVRYMLGVKERTELIHRLRRGSPAGGPWDALLFSGGGNDVVDDPMALWVKDWNPATPPAAHLHEARFNNVLALVRAGYEDLIDIRDKFSPTTHLIFHGYDLAIPDGRDVCGLFGPWLKPTFDLKRFPSLAARQAVVDAMLERFAAMLTQLTDTAGRKVTFINGQGTLPREKNSWHNELHPSDGGFDVFARIFHRKLNELFPGRVA
ncbi:MAG: hypothetical protein FJX48_08435 [Alphaproteobacteria bacterium]|nr:hypothetical protein [Alphaproteobacteria bacterium]